MPWPWLRFLLDLDFSNPWTRSLCFGWSYFLMFTSAFCLMKRTLSSDFMIYWCEDKRELFSFVSNILSFSSMRRRSMAAYLSSLL